MSSNSGKDSLISAFKTLFKAEKSSWKTKKLAAKKSGALEPIDSLKK